jgi:hypothetical protein
MLKTQINLRAAWEYRRTRALQKKITAGRAFAKEMAEALNYNVTHDVETETNNFTLERRRKKLEEGFAGAQATADRLNYNVLNDIDPDRRIHRERPKTFEDAFLSRLRQAGLLDD